VSPYVDPAEQLAVELYVQDIGASAEFYEGLGFRLVRREGKFAELGWEKSRLFLEEVKGQPDPPDTPVANIRILVRDVDSYWDKCRELGLLVIRAIEDRPYGLRDFTVLSPDGIGLRFATKLKPAQR
jgi:catechol 2,3-dioxygenase-like lactoylglutathione lyase family enzyme